MSLVEGEPTLCVCKHDRGAHARHNGRCGAKFRLRYEGRERVVSCDCPMFRRPAPPSKKEEAE